GVPGYEATIWIGVMAPAGTPQPIVTLLNAEINKILARAGIKEAWRKQGAETMSMKPDEFGGFVQSEIDKWAKGIKADDIKPERPRLDAGPAFRVRGGGGRAIFIQHACENAVIRREQGVAQ